MQFSVLKKTSGGNLVLKMQDDEKPAGISKMILYDEREKTAVIFDTIARIESPFYLAKPLKEKGEWEGKILASKNSRER